jgi:hypothetical protein
LIFWKSRRGRKPRAQQTLKSNEEKKKTGVRGV